MSWHDCFRIFALENQEKLSMDYKIEVKCRKCGQVSYVLSKGGRDEVITFVCPNCGKHELLVAYDLNVGHIDDKQKYNLFLTDAT